MTKKPNVIYILADDMGYGDIRAFNEKCPFETPHLDALCKNGVKFTDAHSSSAVCTPSRYSILTGRYNWRSRLKSSVVGGYSEPLIEEGRKTVADLFKENGYRTVMIGKWHLGMSFSKTPDFQEVPDFDACSGVDYKGRIARSPVSNGFDYYYGISGSLDMPPYVYIENNHFTEMPDHETESKGKKYWRKGPTGAHFHHENVLDELTEKVTQEIENNKDGETPFFIYFPMPAPHTPILPGKEFQGKSGTNEYGDFVLHCDDVVGRVTEKLKETGLYDNTIVIYTSDNGCSPMADYKELEEKGQKLYGGIEEILKEAGSEYHVNHVSSLGSLFFAKEEVVDYTSAKSSDTKAFADYFLAMLKQGIHLAPSQFEAMFLSTAHSDEVLEDTLTKIRNYFM